MEHVPRELLSLMTHDVHDLIRLCSTSKGMSNKCSSSFMNSYWISNIEKEFGIFYDQGDAYQEYLRLSWVSDETFWIVTSHDFGEKEASVTLGVYMSFKNAVEGLKRWAKYSRFYYAEKLLSILSTLEKGRQEIDIFDESFIIMPVNLNEDLFLLR